MHLNRIAAAVIGAAALTIGVGALPAGAVEPFSGPTVLAADCLSSGADASIAPDGTVYGFTSCNSVSGDAIRYIRSDATSSHSYPTPYQGYVLASAWDGAGHTYVVFLDGMDLKIAKVTDASLADSAVTVLAHLGATTHLGADVVASDNRWWAVWSTWSDGDEHRQLYQRHTLLGTQRTTRITDTAFAVTDDDPSLAYAAGRVTLVWTRELDTGGAGGEVQRNCTIRRASSTGGGWASGAYTGLGTCNETAQVVAYGGHTYVTWLRDGHIMEADDSTGHTVSKSFNTPGYVPKLAVSYGTVFVGWTTYAGGMVFLAERDGSTWTGANVTGHDAYLAAVLAQRGTARVVYGAGNTLRMRGQAA